MSYIEQYTLTVPFSGTVYYDYPKSEQGGRGEIEYSGEVPVNINLVVDTEPFEHSINGMKYALVNVTKGINNMQTAQIEEIRNLGKRVSETAVNGFFRVIGNDISHEMSENKNTLTSNIALLAEKGRAIETIHSQMESDYKRIWSRYRDVFHRLDIECENSIMELDREVFNIAARKKLIMYKQFQSDAGNVLSLLSETGIPELLITGARVNKKMSGIVEKITDTAKIAEQYQTDSKKICNNISLNEKQYEYIPVIYVQTDDLFYNSQKITSYTSEVENQDMIKGCVEAMVTSIEDSFWKELESEDLAEIDRYFMIRCENYMENSEDKRIYDEILKLYRKDKIETICEN